MAIARLVWNEDGTISAHEIVEKQYERMEILYDPDVVDVMAVTKMMRDFMSIVLGRPVRLEIAGKPNRKKLNKTKYFVPIGEPMKLK